jgi:amino acid adenylation domain-containing protein
VRFLVHHLVADAARTHPDNVAVFDRDRSLTYRQLDEQSNRLAQILAQKGVAKGDRVGLYLDKTLESVIGVYAVMKSGAAYVPLDPDAPVARLAYIVRDCGIRCLLTGSEKIEELRAMLDLETSVETVVILNADAFALAGVNVAGQAEVNGSPLEPVSVDVIDQDLAYILYTSGSTGDPKGVMLTHRNALAFIAWAAEEFRLVPSDRLSSHAPLHFDLSVFDLYAAAYAGAAVVLVPSKASIFPNQIVRFIQDNAITVWYSVPSILSMVTLRGGLGNTEVPTLRTVLFAGEVFPVKYLRQLMKLVPHARFANLYGPTETNVCTWYEVPPIDDDVTEPVPIGIAIANDEVFAIKEDGGQAQAGEVGELYVRGATVMRGYWGDPERTARGLVPDPFRSAFADPVYRTGDLVEVQTGGGFRYVGRKDAQIKSRGYRIELGDIEAAINLHPKVFECAVVAVADEMVTNRLVAYVTVRDQATAHELTRFCEERLPRYMIPESFTLLSELPKTSTGKIDRRQLLVKAKA